MLRKVRVLMTCWVGRLVGEEVEGVRPPAHLAGELDLAAAVLPLLLNNLLLLQEVSLLLGREVEGAAGADLQVGQEKMVMVRPSRRKRMRLVVKRSYRGERVRERNPDQNRRAVARGEEMQILKRRSRRRCIRSKSESEIEFVLDVFPHFCS